MRLPVPVFQRARFPSYLMLQDRALKLSGVTQGKPRMVPHSSCGQELGAARLGGSGPGCRPVVAVPSQPGGLAEAGRPTPAAGEAVPAVGGGASAAARVGLSTRAMFARPPGAAAGFPQQTKAEAAVSSVTRPRRSHTVTSTILSWSHRTSWRIQCGRGLYGEAVITGGSSGTSS